MAGWVSEEVGKNGRGGCYWILHWVGRSVGLVVGEGWKKRCSRSGGVEEKGKK